MQRFNKDIELLRNAKCFLMDMDGTIYLGNEIFDGTLDFLALLKEQGKRVGYITNNSSKAVSQYMEKLAKMGIKSQEDEFSTAVHATVHFLNKEKPGAKVYVVGTDALKNYLREAGFHIVKGYVEPGNPEERPDFVVFGSTTELVYDDLRTICDYVSEGVTYWVTNPDDVIPVEGGKVIPDVGAFMAFIHAATGKHPQLIAGKPNPCVINMVKEKYGYKNHEIAVVGDRYDTDLMSAINAGVLSVCVLSGMVQPDDIATLPIQPDYVIDNIRKLYELLL